MQIQQFITNFRESLRLEISESTCYISNELLYMIDSCLLKAYLNELPKYEPIIDE
jgi:hypothetical protein